MRKSGRNVFRMSLEVRRKRLERHWKSGGNVLECDRKSDGTVPLLNFISQNNVFEKISEKKSKKYFLKNLRKLFFRVFGKISEKHFQK